MEGEDNNAAMEQAMMEAGGDEEKNEAKADENTPLNDTVESKHRFIEDSEVCCCCICNCSRKETE